MGFRLLDGLVVTDCCGCFGLFVSCFGVVLVLLCLFLFALLILVLVFVINVTLVVCVVLRLLFGCCFD